MTAVEWLLNELEKGNFQEQQNAIIQAKEMEKQQIIDAYNSGQQIPPFDFAEQYYNETFKRNKTRLQG